MNYNPNILNKTGTFQKPTIDTTIPTFQNVQDYPNQNNSPVTSATSDIFKFLGVPIATGAGSNGQSPSPNTSQEKSNSVTDKTSGNPTNSISGDLAGAATAAPKPNLFDEWQRQKAQMESGQTGAPIQNTQLQNAASGLAETAMGKPSLAQTAAIQASREALARQANNQRMATSAAAAQSGQLDQGNTMRSVGATENTIATGIAGQNLAEQQSIGQSQQLAQQALLNYGQTQNNQQAQVLENLLANGSPSQQFQAQAALQQLSGASMGKDTNQINAEAVAKAESDPAYKLQQVTANTALAQASQQQTDQAQQIAYAPYLKLAEASGKVLQSDVQGKYTGGYLIDNGKVGDYVKLPNGNPAEIVAVDAIGLNQAGHALYQWTLKDPVTGTVSKFKQTRNDAGMVNRVTTGDVKL